MQAPPASMVFYMLSTTNVQTFFEKSKKKQLFRVMDEDI